MFGYFNFPKKFLCTEKTSVKLSTSVALYAGLDSIIAKIFGNTRHTIKAFHLYMFFDASLDKTFAQTFVNTCHTRKAFHWCVLFL